MALGRTSFPDTGLVIGVVLDSNGTPPTMPMMIAATASDGTPDGTIEYLSADRRNLIAGGTSANGIFISQDTPYGSTFTANGAKLQAALGYGGLVEGKVSIVVLQFDHPAGT
jgi:hypothetical protein